MAIEAVVEEVATNLEEVAQVTRSINTQALGYLGTGLVVGGLAGFYIGFKLNRAKIKADAMVEANEQISEMREIYQQKLMARAATDKPPVEDVVQELGLHVTVTNPSEALGYIQPSTESEAPQVQYNRPLPAPVPILDDLPENPTGNSKSKNAGWSYPRELESRSANAPYVIHQDEWSEGERGYSKVTYTYYEPDDVLVDEADEKPVPHGDLIVGQDNLKFGHGTDNEDVVFVRNDRLEIDIEICRSRKSYDDDES